MHSDRPQHHQTGVISNFFEKKKDSLFVITGFTLDNLPQLLADLFSRLLSRVKEEPFISVSFIQVCPCVKRQKS